MFCQWELLFFRSLHAEGFLAVGMKFWVEFCSLFWGIIVYSDWQFSFDLCIWKP